MHLRPRFATLLCMAKRSPSALTMSKLAEDGWLAETVERWIPYTRRRKDLFGCFDHIAIRGGETLAVQSTSRSNVSARLKKIRASENLVAMQAAGWRLEVWGWDRLDGADRLRVELV